MTSPSETRHSRPILLMTLLLCAFLTLQPALSAKAQPPEGQPFETDFETGALGPGWEATPDVTFSEGALRLYGGNFAMKLGRWSDQTTHIRLRFNTSMGEFLIHYCASEQGSYNLVFLPEVILLEKGGGPEDITALVETANTLPTDAWINLEIAVQSGQHTIRVDQEILLTAVDPAPLPPGNLGFRKFGGDSVDIDSLSLTPAPGNGQPAAGEAEAPALPQTTPTPAATETTGGSLFETVQNLFDTQGTQVDLLTFLINLLLSVVLAYILGRVYIYWGGSLSNRRKFAANFMLMTVTTTFIILVVRSSVALSLGLVGALSIVRFRTAIKEPEELAYLFFAIGIGIGLGDNQRVITIIAFAIAIAIIGLLKLFRRSGADVNLHLTITSHAPQSLSLEDIMEALKPHTAKLKLLRLDETRGSLEAAFLVEFKHIEKLNRAREAVQGLAPEASITFLDNKGIW